MALGSSPGEIVRWVLARAGRFAGFGVIAGLAGTVALTRFLQGILYDVSPVDPLVLGSLVLILPAVVLTAALLPALRAARLEPVRALQIE